MRAESIHQLLMTMGCFMKKFLALGLALSAAVTPAFAGTTIFTGNTTGGPIFNRPLANGNNAPTALSGVGTTVRYTVTPFTVSVSGNYSFNAVAANPATYDNYLGIHRNSFNPASPLVNAVAYNDDFTGGIGSSGFAALALLAGVSYFAINTGFDTPDFGAYTLTISGPGNIVGGGVAPGVPEPATWAMMIFGFAGIGAALRRRRAGPVAVTA
jgi:hypothetical protein